MTPWGPRPDYAKVLWAQQLVTSPHLSTPPRNAPKKPLKFAFWWNKLCIYPFLFFLSDPDI